MKRKPLSPNEIEMLVQPSEENEDKIVNEIVDNINTALIEAKMKKHNLKLSRKEDDRDFITAEIGGVPKIFLLHSNPYFTVIQFEQAIELFEANGWKGRIIKTETDYEFCQS